MQSFRAKRAEPIRIAVAAPLDDRTTAMKWLLAFAALAVLLIGAQIRLQAMEISSLPQRVSALSAVPALLVAPHDTRIAASLQIPRDVD